MKKFTFLLILTFLFLCGCSGEAPEEAAETAETINTSQIGSSAYSCVTGASEEQVETTETGTVKVKAFSHRIYNPNNDYVVTLTTVLTISCPDADGSQTLADVSGSLSDAQKDGFTISEHLAGDTGTIVLYLNQTSVCHFQYRLHSDGTIELL